MESTEFHLQYRLHQTKTGNHFASRVSTSLLHALDLAELCCDDLNSYKKMIIQICTNEEIKLNILDKLTYKNKFNSTHDNRRFAKNLEKTLLGIL